MSRGCAGDREAEANRYTAEVGRIIIEMLRSNHILIDFIAVIYTYLWTLVNSLTSRPTFSSLGLKILFLDNQSLRVLCA